MKGLDETARDFVQIFDAAQIPYVLMGGLAVRLYALPRPTFDVDFTVALPRESLPDLYRRAEGLGYSAPAVQRPGWIDTVRGLPVVKFQLFFGDRAIDVDLFLAETPFQRQLFDRRQKHKAIGCAETRRPRTWWRIFDRRQTR